MSANHHRGANGFDLHAAGVRIMRANGFDPDFGPEVQRQLATLHAAAAAAANARDLRQLPWSSIDNTESRDLDQIEIAESLADGSIRVVVAIADVDALVSKGTPIDEHAHASSTSVYAGVDVFP